jgi:RTX calcium-binding nonapeptide repeat (4 copies)
MSKLWYAYKHQLLVLTMSPRSVLLGSALIQSLLAINPAAPGLNRFWSGVLSARNFVLYIANFSWKRLLAEHPAMTPDEVRQALERQIGPFNIRPNEGSYGDQPDCHQAEAQLAEHLNLKYLHHFYDLLSILALLSTSESSSSIGNHDGDDQGGTKKSSSPSSPLRLGGGFGVMTEMSETASTVKESIPNRQIIADRYDSKPFGYNTAQIFSFNSTGESIKLDDSVGDIASIELEQLFTNSPQTILPLSGPRQVASPLIKSVPIEPQIAQLMPQPRGFESIQQTSLPITTIYSASTNTTSITTPRRVSVNVSNQLESVTPTPIPLVLPLPLQALKEEIANPILNIDASNPGGQILIPLNVGTVEITNFIGVGRGTNPDPKLIPTIDTVQFIGPGLIAKYLQMEQKGKDVVLTFEGNDRTAVILKNIALDTIDNLDDRTSTSLRVGNILFDGDKTIKDSFDVFNSDWYQNVVLNLNTTTFLNDLDNFVYGFDNSDDVINGQGGNDTLFGLGGNDILRGGSGNDVLIGGLGQNQLVGNTGQDIFVIYPGGISDVMDFTFGEDKIGLTKGITYDSLQFVAFTDSSRGGTQIWRNNQLVMNILGIRPNQLTSEQFTPWQQDFKLP